MSHDWGVVHAAWLSYFHPEKISRQVTYDIANLKAAMGFHGFCCC